LQQQFIIKQSTNLIHHQCWSF